MRVAIQLTSQSNRGVPTIRCPYVKGKVNEMVQYYICFLHLSKVTITGELLSTARLGPSSGRTFAFAIVSPNFGQRPLHSVYHS